VGYGDTAAIYANLLIGVVNVLLTLVAIRLIDRIGRKPLLLGGLVGMVASLPFSGSPRCYSRSRRARRAP
jgi:MFS family permease